MFRCRYFRDAVVLVANRSHVILVLLEAQGANWLMMFCAPLGELFLFRMQLHFFVVRPPSSRFMLF
jgi:hypothetical protein